MVWGEQSMEQLVRSLLSCPLQSSSLTILIYCEVSYSKTNHQFGCPQNTALQVANANLQLSCLYVRAEPTL